MTEIRLKRVYDKYEEGDGLRILVDRLWPRGMKKESLHYDIWAKELAPSNKLREWMHGDKNARWADFSVFYEQELTGSGCLPSFIGKIEGHDVITLLFAAKDEHLNNAVILKEVLEKELSKHKLD